MAERERAIVRAGTFIGRSAAKLTPGIISDDRKAIREAAGVHKDGHVYFLNWSGDIMEIFGSFALLAGAYALGGGIYTMGRAHNIIAERAARKTLNPEPKSKSNIQNRLEEMRSQV